MRGTGLPTRESMLSRDRAPAPRRHRQRPSRAPLLFQVGTLEDCLGLALWEVFQVVVVRRHLHEPIHSHVRDHADEVFRREDKLVVDAELGLVREARGGVQGHNLVVLDREVVPRPFEVRHLHEEAREDGAPDVGVVVLVVEVGGLELKAEAAHDAHQLGPHAVRRLHRPRVQEVVVAPGCGLRVVLPGVVDVEELQVVAVLS
mmetsp:Transcript_17153/g.49759  ORF Transcript_17153/g.49759 Transcript_17153/m.49759 type:complete len:203 (+) Transcript_17153:61-669(+)